MRLKKHMFRPIELKNHIFWPTELKNQIFRPLDTRLNSDPLDTRLNLHFIRKKSCFSEVNRLTPYPLDNRWTPLDPCLTPASPLKVEFLASEIEKIFFALKLICVASEIERKRFFEHDISHICFFDLKRVSSRSQRGDPLRP